MDALLADGHRPDELWADRGYASAELDAELCARAIEPKISKPRRPGEPIPPGTPTREFWRGRRRRTKTADPNARHRWPVERTFSWLRNWRRVATRWERRPELWLAAIQIAASMTLYHILERSFR